MRSARLSKQASLIDVGGGESRFVDRLIDEGFEDITVLDISEQAIERAKARLGKNLGKINWVVADITEFKTEKLFDFWHDRATFHFLTTPDQIELYLGTARKNVRNNGYLTIGTFSLAGPEKCSGLQVKRYSEQTLQTQLSEGFEKIRCVAEYHKTPFDTLQSFLFCSFRRL